jgi:shikimate dehydrogenase
MILSSRSTENLSRAQPKRAFLLGTDISKSISPFIQNAAFDKLRINARYDLGVLSPEKLGYFVSSISKAQNILGFNVTSPFKEEIIKYLQSLDLRSKSIGAVNTVKVSKTQGMRGFNTDYDGVIATLRKLGCLTSPRKKKGAVVIGAGGASRACVFALLDSGYTHLTILNRTVQKAEIISKQFAFQFPNSNMGVVPLTKGSFTKSLENGGIIINAISNSNSKYFPVELDFSLADKGTKFFDLGYKQDSLFLTTARKKGFQVMNGLLMLVVQAAKSFEIWTGKKAPFRTMMLAAKKALKKSN